MTTSAEGLEIVPSRPEHEPQILELLAGTLGRENSALEAEFFRWKHTRNPFGSSRSWVALVGGEVVGFRTFLRWEFVHDGATVGAVRAVDTATRADQQGKGIFTRLTQRALEALEDEGVALVFNTPNDQSRPGYLKMGWQVVGRLPVGMRPTSLRSLVRIVGARAPADRWPQECSTGIPAPDVMADASALRELLSETSGGAGLQTHRSVEFLRWRYGWDPLGYRAVTVSRDPAEGVAIFRTRRRGDALEASLLELLVPELVPRIARDLVGRIARATGVDYVLRLTQHGRAGGFLPVPRSGPVLTARALGATPIPAMAEWRLGLGDVELF